MHFSSPDWLQSTSVVNTERCCWNVFAFMVWNYLLSFLNQHNKCDACYFTNAEHKWLERNEKLKFAEGSGRSRSFRQHHLPAPSGFESFPGLLICQGNTPPRRKPICSRHFYVCFYLKRAAFGKLRWIAAKCLQHSTKVSATTESECNNRSALFSGAACNIGTWCSVATFPLPIAAESACETSFLCIV